MKLWSWAWITGVFLVAAAHADAIRQERYRYPDGHVSLLVGERTWLLCEEETARRVRSRPRPRRLAIRVGGEPWSGPIEEAERAGQEGPERAMGADDPTAPRWPESSPHATGTLLEESP